MKKIPLLRYLFLFLLMTLPWRSYALVVDDLFEVSIPVPDESPGVRSAALSDGLAEILIRVSGDGQILQKLIPPRVTGYVKQYRYVVPESDKKVMTHQAREKEKKLWVQYNATRVMDYLRQNGIPIWGEHRPELVIWLAVRDGVNSYVLKEEDISPIKDMVEKIFHQRGVPVIWPRFDKKDQKKVTFADIWGGFKEPLAEASRRYGNGPILSGNLSWNGHQWLSNWILQIERENQWSMAEASHDNLLARISNLVADNLGSKYAVLESTNLEDLKQVAIDVEQVNSVENYVTVENYLASLTSVQRVNLSRLESGRVTFNISIRSQVEDFLSLLKTDDLIKPAPDIPVLPGNPNEQTSQIEINNYRFVFSQK